MSDDFLALSPNLPNLFKGANPDQELLQQQVAQGDAFKSGLPLDVNGNPDYSAMTNRLMQLGAYGPASGLMNMGIAQQQMKDAAKMQQGLGAWAGVGAAPGPGVTPVGGAQPAAYVRAAPGFDSAVSRTLGFEGGLNPSDTNGTPTNYGINQAAHPDIDVSQLTPDQAKSIYKSDYWDAIGADKMPPALGRVAFDTAVVAGPAKAQDLIAQSGGDPMKLLSLREQYQQGLIASNPEKYGPYAKVWTARNNGLRFDVGALNASQQAAQPSSAGPQVASNIPSSTENKATPDDEAPVSSANPYGYVGTPGGPGNGPVSGENPSLAPGAASTSGPVPPQAAGQVAGPGAPTGPAPLPRTLSPPPPLSPSAGAVPAPLDPTFGGQVPAAWLKAGHSAGEWVNYARAMAGLAGNNPYAKAAGEQWTKIADGLASSIDKSLAFTPEQKNARDPTALAYEQNKATQSANARVNARYTPEAIRGAGQLASAQENARADITNQNTLVPVAQPDGSVQMTTKANALQAAADGKPITQSLPGYITSGQQNLATKLADGTVAYQERQVSGERLDAISNLLSTYQTGANSTDFNNAVAKLKSFGIAVPNSATINPAAMQQFTKNAYANVLSNMKEQGNKQFVSEVQSAVNSNPNPDLQPEANAAMVAQMKGIQAYHNQNFQDYANWYDKNKGAPNDAQFQIGWAKANPVSTFISAAQKEIAPVGVAIPPAASRVPGQRYNIPGKGVYRWMRNGWAAS